MLCDGDTNLETMYSWGAVSNGELGLGGLEKPHVALPSKVPLSDTIRYVLVLVVTEVRGLTMKCCQSVLRGAGRTSQPDADRGRRTLQLRQQRLRAAGKGGGSDQVDGWIVFH